MGHGIDHYTLIIMNIHKIRRVAANTIEIGDNKITQAIVEISNDTVIKYYPFYSEQANTEWLGGTIRILIDEKGKEKAFWNGSLLTQSVY